MLSLYLSVIDDEGQRREFEEIYIKYRQAMFYQAQIILCNEADAEDVVHTVFMLIAARYMNLISSMETLEDVRNYLLKATKNTALNEIKQKRRTDISLDDASDSQISSGLTDEAFLEHITLRVQYNQVLEAILSLDDAYRDTLYAHFVLGMTASQIAKYLNRNISTVKKQLLRGKKLLLAKLEQEEESHL